MRRINPDRPLTESERNKRFYGNHKEAEIARNLKYCRDNKEKVAKRVRLKKFEMTVEEHDIKMSEQDNKCAICKKPFVKTPHIDHNHECCPTRKTCGKCNRGLLCDDCNLGLGRFKDSIEVLSNAIQYLKEYQK